MNILEIIEKKKHGDALTKEEIYFAVDGYVNDVVKDYQMSALLMAICINGMNEEETVELTKSYIDSGETIDLSEFGITVDKHSTGGVGDKTTLIITPILASLGLTIAKFSGRGLGHTGGTVDKLEAIKGFDTELSSEEFTNQLKEHNIVLVGQTKKIVVADKMIYALRDVSATVDSISLIAASIMSKKIASGSSTIFLDVKYGSGAFMKTVEDAQLLANEMVKIGKSMNRDTIAIISSMEQPLGKSVGNANEVQESIDFLDGKEVAQDLKELCYKLCVEVLLTTSKAKNEEDAIKMIDEAISSKKALNKFIDFITAQKSCKEALYSLDKPKNIITLKAVKSGYIKKVDAITIGDVARKLGAGRLKKEDVIDYAAGIEVYVKVGDKVSFGDKLFDVLENNTKFSDDLLKELNSAIEIVDEKVEKINVFEKIIR